MFRSFSRFFLLFLAFSGLFRGGLHAAQIELIGGRIAVQPDGRVMLSLEVSAQRLPLFAGETPGVYQKWFQVRQREREILATFREGLRQRVGEQDVAAATVAFPTLEATPPSGDDTDLPDFVTLTATWDKLPAAGELVTQFAIPETKVVLTLEDPSGQRVGIFANATAENTIVPEVATAGAAGDRVSFWPLVWFGFAHIVPRGIDHFLFLLGLCLAAGRARQAWGQVAVFILAHTAAAGWVVGGGVEVDVGWSRAIDVVIACSLVLVAAENIFAHDTAGGRRLALVALLGFIHGFGFAGDLADTRSWLAWSASSVGLAIGQVVVVGLLLSLTAWGRRHGWYRRWLVVPGSAAVGLGGVVLAMHLAGGP